ncbi:MAG: DUF192 domain-containing protein [Candidatus Omnitrophica bacterium]|nr:DUF192 domain-containing protein [Candidatus Omnitrophota bacterium]
MKKTIFTILLVLLFSSCAVKKSPAADQVCFKEKCFNVEVMTTNEELMRGLMFRKSLDPDAGMLFVFPQSLPYHFWMKNTLIALDMIWLDESYKIVYIASNVPPCIKDPCPSYAPESSARYVLELNAGACQKFGISVGEMAKIILK